MMPLQLLEKSINEKLTIAEKAWLINQTEKYPYFSVLHFIQARNASGDPRKDSLHAIGAIYATDRLRYVDFLQVNPTPVLEPLPELIEPLPAATTIEKKELSPEENSRLIEKNEDKPVIAAFSAAPPAWQNEKVNLKHAPLELSPSNSEELSENYNSLKKDGELGEVFVSPSYPSESESLFIPNIFNEVDASKHISLRLDRLLNIAKSVYQSLYWTIRKELNERFTALAVDKMLQGEKAKLEASTTLALIDEQKPEISKPLSSQEKSFKKEQTEETKSHWKNRISAKDSPPMDAITPEVDEENFIWEVSLASSNPSNYSLLSLNTASPSNVAETLKPILDENIEDKLTNEPLIPELVVDEFVKLYETTGGLTASVPNRVEETDKKVVPQEEEKDWYAYLTQNPIRTPSFNRFVPPDFQGFSRKNEDKQLVEPKDIKTSCAYLNKNLFADTLSDKGAYKNNEDIDIAVYDSAGSAALAQFTPPSKKQAASPSSYSFLPEKITSDSMKRFIEPDFGLEDKKSFQLGVTSSQPTETKDSDSAPSIISAAPEKISSPGEELFMSSSGKLAAPISSDSFKRFVVPDFGISPPLNKQNKAEPSFPSSQQQSAYSKAVQEANPEVSERFQVGADVLQQWGEASNLPKAEAIQEGINKPQKISSPSFQRFVEPDFGVEPTNRPTKESLQAKTPSSKKQKEPEIPLEKSKIQQNSELDQNYTGKLPQAIRTDSFNRFVEPDFTSHTPMLRSAETSPKESLKSASAIAEVKENDLKNPLPPEKKQAMEKTSVPNTISYVRKNIAFEIIIKPEHSHLVNTNISLNSEEVKSEEKNLTTNLGLMVSETSSAPLAPVELQQSSFSQNENVEAPPHGWLIIQEGEKSVTQEKTLGAVLEETCAEQTKEEKTIVSVLPLTKSVAENRISDSIVATSGQDTASEQDKLQNVAKDVNIQEPMQVGLESASMVEATQEGAQSIQSEQGWREEPSFFTNVVSSSSTSSFVLDFLEEEDYNISTEALLASNIDDRIDRFRKNLDKIRKKINPLISAGLSLLEIQQRFLEGIAQSMTKQRQSAASFIEEIEAAEQIHTSPPPEHLKNANSIDDLLERFSKFEPTIYQNIETKNFIPSSFATFQIQDSDLTEEEESDYVTETLAKIHVKQGNKDRAIKIYKKLKLKFPEKSSYFEAAIQQLLASS